MNNPQNEGGASVKTRLPNHGLSSSGVSRLLAKKTSTLRLAFVALSPDELREYLAENYPKEARLNV